MRADSRLVTLALAASIVVGTCAWLAPAQAVETPKIPSSEEFVVSDPEIDEASGMVASQLHEGVVYIVEDSGNGAYVYAVGPDGETVATYRLANARNVDWEAMAPGTDSNGNPMLWIGDIGDNDSRRESIRVYAVDEPAELVDSELRWTKVDFTYPDRAHNAEALLSDPGTGQLFVVTKEALGAGTYAAPVALDPGATYELTRVGDAPMFVTDGAISPKGSPTVLRTYGQAIVTDGPGGAELAGYRLPPSPQGETLAFTADGSAVLVGSEGVSQPVYRVELPKNAASSPSPSSGNGSTSANAAESPTTSSSNGTGRTLALGLAAVVLVSLLVGAILATRRSD